MLFSGLCFHEESGLRVESERISKKKAMNRIGRRGLTSRSTDLNDAAMVGGRMIVFFKFVVELRELQMDDSFFRVRAYEGASETFNGLSQSGRTQVNHVGLKCNRPGVAIQESKGARRYRSGNNARIR